MGKRRVYTGAYTRCPHPSHQVSSSRSNKTEFQKWVLKYISMVYSTVVSSYLPIVIVVVVLLLTLFLPNKVNKNNDLEVMKKVLDHMTKEVDRAEAACLTAANEVHCLRSSLCDEETETTCCVPVMIKLIFISIMNLVIWQTRDLRDLSVCTSRGLFSTQSEPVQVEKKIGIFRRFFPQRNISKKEIAIMSIVYTDSFDTPNRLTELEKIM